MIEQRYETIHDPNGFACNMGYVVVDRQTNRNLHRGPQWACDLRTKKLNEGSPLDRMSTLNVEYCPCGAEAKFPHPRTGSPSCGHPACVIHESLTNGGVR